MGDDYQNYPGLNKWSEWSRCEPGDKQKKRFRKPCHSCYIQFEFLLCDRIPPGEDYQYQAGGDYREAGPPFVDLRGDYQIPTQGLDYQTQAAGEDYRSDQWGQWSRCTQGRKTKNRCKQREDLCETLLCKPKAFGPRGDYQIQAPGGADYQLEPPRPGDMIF